MDMSVSARAWVLAMIASKYSKVILWIMGLTQAKENFGQTFNQNDFIADSLYNKLSCRVIGQRIVKNIHVSEFY